MAFTKGTSGNPGGRPKGFKEHLRKLIGKDGEKALEVIWEIAQGTREVETWFGTKDGPMSAMTKPSHKEQLAAAIVLHEHLNGKPSQAVDVEHSGSVTISIVTNVGGK